MKEEAEMVFQRGEGEKLEPKKDFPTRMARNPFHDRLFSTERLPDQEVRIHKDREIDFQSFSISNMERQFTTHSCSVHLSPWEVMRH